MKLTYAAWDCCMSYICCILQHLFKFATLPWLFIFIIMKHFGVYVEYTYALAYPFKYN